MKLSQLDGHNGFTIEGIEPYDYFGSSVNNGGDINKDGFDDIVIGAPIETSYVVFGNSNVGKSGLIEASKLDGHNGFTLKVPNTSISSSGDINGDGIDDIVLGGFIGSVEDKIGVGYSYIVFGKATLGKSGSVESSVLNGRDGLILSGIDERDFFGHSVSNAGDVNNDGIDDIVITAPGADSNFNVRSSYEPGDAYIIFGSEKIAESSLREISSLDGSKSLVLEGYGSDVPSVSFVGHANDITDNNSISNAGDINGDGIDDVVIGVSGIYTASKAEAYVIFGSPQKTVDTLDTNYDQTLENKIDSNNLIEGQLSVVAMFTICFLALVAKFKKD